MTKAEFVEKLAKRRLPNTAEAIDHLHIAEQLTRGAGLYRFGKFSAVKRLLEPESIRAPRRRLNRH
jgi:hypothetical protein